MSEQTEKLSITNIDLIPTHLRDDFLDHTLIRLLRIHFEVSEINKKNSSNEESFMFWGCSHREGAAEVIRIGKHFLHQPAENLRKITNMLAKVRIYLGNFSDLFSIRSSNFKEDFGARLAWTVTIKSPLTAVAVDVIDEAISFIVNIKNHIAHGPFTDDLSEILVLSVLF